MLTRCPSPEAIRCGRNSLVPCTTPQKLIPMIQSMSGYSRSTRSPASATPALLTTRLTWPKCSTTSGGVRRERGPVGDVEVVGAHLADAGVLDQVDGLGETLVVDVGEREPRALAGEVDRQRPADAGAGAGDHGDLAVEALHAGTSSRDGASRAAYVVGVGVELGELAPEGDRRLRPERGVAAVLVEVPALAAAAGPDGALHPALEAGVPPPRRPAAAARRTPSRAGAWCGSRRGRRRPATR